jgi:hypothetical protein
MGSCGLIAKIFHRKPGPVDAEPHEMFIGTVEMVNPEQHFVLIRTAMRFKLEPGWKLETRPVSGSKSVLTIAPEQKLNYLSADITEGFPQRGEVVVLPAQKAGAPAAVDPSSPLPRVDGGGAELPLPSRAPTGEELPPPVR